MTRNDIVISVTWKESHLSRIDKIYLKSSSNVSLKDPFYLLFTDVTRSSRILFLLYRNQSWVAAFTRNTRASSRSIEYVISTTALSVTVVSTFALLCGFFLTREYRKAGIYYARHYTNENYSPHVFLPRDMRETIAALRNCPLRKEDSLKYQRYVVNHCPSKQLYSNYLSYPSVLMEAWIAFFFNL